MVFRPSLTEVLTDLVCVTLRWHIARVEGSNPLGSPPSYMVDSDKVPTIWCDTLSAKPHIPKCIASTNAYHKDRNK